MAGSCTKTALPIQGNKIVREGRTSGDTVAPVGEHLDQLLLLMALAAGGRFLTAKPSLHTLTNIAVIRRFLACAIEAVASGAVWTVTVAKTQ